MALQWRGGKKKTAGSEGPGCFENKQRTELLSRLGCVTASDANQRCGSREEQYDGRRFRRSARIRESGCANVPPLQRLVAAAGAVARVVVATDAFTPAAR